MKASPVVLDTPDVARHMAMTVVVQKTPWFDLRLAIGCALLRLGAKVLGVGIVKVGE